MTPSVQSRTLVLLRHAKSSYPDGLPDHDRPLAPRGRHEAQRAGDAITQLTNSVDAVLCSTAARARQTLGATGIVAPTTFADDIYAATSGAILTLIRRQPDTAQTLLVVGHAPGIPGLALALAGERSDPAAIAALHAGYPTSAIAVLTSDYGWSGLGSTDTRLVSFIVPR